MSANPQFFLGKTYDPAAGKLTDQRLTLDPANFTTHAIVTGMTGSGKTGLCVGMLEEAALQGVPAIIIDPKGDLTNLILHFPELLPADFEPWVDPDAARRASKPVPEFAADTAANWKKGLGDWGLGRDQLIALRDSVRFTVFTPGSSSGVPVNILSSFQPPEGSWEDNREVARERISVTVTALLSLIGLGEIDPLRSREHILLSNILESSWSQGKHIDLTELILQTQTPPFERLGAFPLDSFYPAKDRFELAMLLNNFLASPSFQTWLEGEPLDIAAMLYTPDGKPRHSIFYIAHLSDAERMFFVTLLLAAVEGWMRGQRGTSGLRALVYFDEIFGYLPPVARPPSHTIMLRLLKQARAFGVGMLLATQNPVDVDYKALSNAGLWFIGRLQTDQDKQRLLDGLQNTSGSVDVRELDRLISTLQKRVFVLQSIYKPAPSLFSSRWALNYLAGPLTRTQIPAVNKLAGVQAAALPAAAVRPDAKPTGAARTSSRPAAKPAAASTAGSGFYSTRPAVPQGMAEYFLPNDLGVSAALEGLNLTEKVAPDGILYRPALIAQAQVRYLNARYKLDYTSRVARVIWDLDGSLAHWDERDFVPVDADQVESQPLPGSKFAGIPGWLTDARRLTQLQKDFTDWVIRSATVRVRANAGLKIYAAPDVSAAEFHKLCAEAARDGTDAEQDKVRASYASKLRTLQTKINSQEAKVEKLEDAVGRRKTETFAAGAELVIGLLGGRKRSVSSSLSKGRMAKDAANDLEAARKLLEELQKQLEELQAEQEEALQGVKDRWAEVIADDSELPLAPARKDVYVELFGLAWLPYYLVPQGDQLLEAPGFKQAE